MSRSFLLTLALFSAFTLSAQLQLTGLWEGTISLSGPEGFANYPLQVYLDKAGKKVTGRCYIYLTNEQIVETQLSGRLYDDLSIYIDDIVFVPNDKDDYEPPFLRKYQLIWQRGINGSALNGYWQETRKDIFAESRQRGRIALRKVVDSKA
jgi:hypothetical protein